MLRSISKVSLNILLLVAFAGCGSSDNGKTDMTAIVTSFSAELTEFKTVAEEHKNNISAAADLAATVTEADAYLTEANHHHQGMHHSFEEMQGCTHEGHPPHTDDLDTALEGLKTELTAHNTAMHAAADLVAAQAEEDRHQTAIAGFVADIETHFGEVFAEATSFSCPAGHNGGH